MMGCRHTMCTAKHVDRFAKCFSIVKVENCLVLSFVFDTLDVLPYKLTTSSM